MTKEKDKKDREPESPEDKKKSENQEALPYCTTAPSAEQARASDEDEPCDDGRTGS